MIFERGEGDPQSTSDPLLLRIGQARPELACLNRFSICFRWCLAWVRWTRRQSLVFNGPRIGWSSILHALPNRFSASANVASIATRASLNYPETPTPEPSWEGV